MKVYDTKHRIHYCDCSFNKVFNSISLDTLGRSILYWFSNDKGRIKLKNIKAENFYSKDWKKTALWGSVSGKYDLIIDNGKLYVLKHKVNMGFILGFGGIIVLNIVGLIIGYLIDRNTVKKNRSKWKNIDGSLNQGNYLKAIKKVVSLSDFDTKVNVNIDKGLLTLISKEKTFKNKKQIQTVVNFIQENK